MIQLLVCFLVEAVVPSRLAATAAAVGRREGRCFPKVIELVAENVAVGEVGFELVFDLFVLFCHVWGMGQVSEVYIAVGLQFAELVLFCNFGVKLLDHTVGQ